MYKALLIIFLCGTFVASEAQMKGEIQEVESAFEIYKQALVEGKGLAAFDYLSASSVKYYEDLLGSILFASKEEVEGMSLIDKMTVLASRSKIPTDQAKTMTAKDFFVFAIDQGMIGKSSVQGLEISHVVVKEKKATGKMVTNGIETPFDVLFAKEDDKWKVDITSVYPAVSDMLGKFMSATGQSESEFAFQMVQMMTGDTPSEKVWEPLIKRQD